MQWILKTAREENEGWMWALPAETLVTSPLGSCQPQGSTQCKRELGLYSFPLLSSSTSWWAGGQDGWKQCRGLGLSAAGLPGTGVLREGSRESGSNAIHVGGWGVCSDESFPHWVPGLPFQVSRNIILFVITNDRGFVFLKLKDAQAHRTLTKGDISSTAGKNLNISFYNLITTWFLLSVRVVTISKDMDKWTSVEYYWFCFKLYIFYYHSIQNVLISQVLYWTQCGNVHLSSA